ncbi:hypothetical protein ACH5RR_006270 [Cinchona calisaya]|uniref:RBR-type E3 ubiquitin transferase n=1 Tax=Cinchona calisaya TaxID=153742 RepID=A0ABD3ANK0_9GENT
MGSKAPEVVILNDNGVDDEDDDISVLYAKPILLDKGKNSNNPISVESYSEDKDLQLAIMASLQQELKGTRRKTRRVIDLSHDDDVEVLYSFPTTSRKIFEGESSNSEPDYNIINCDDNNSDNDINFMCDICVDQKPMSALFRIKGCTHSYCSECMAKYVASRLQDNVTGINCPVSGCVGRLEPEYCRSILPAQVFDRWGDALCEALILGSEKFYCPYKDCSSLLIDDRNGAGEDITHSECPDCRRLFCAKCRVPWHSEILCAEFQKLNKDERDREDILLMNLAKNKKWIRCPKCKIYVEKISGCLFIRCRCGFTFCYSCGTHMQISHYCVKCRH